MFVTLRIVFFEKPRLELLCSARCTRGIKFTRARPSSILLRNLKSSYLFGSRQKPWARFMHFYSAYTSACGEALSARFFVANSLSG